MEGSKGNQEAVATVHRGDEVRAVGRKKTARAPGKTTAFRVRGLALNQSPIRCELCDPKQDTQPL